MTFRRLMAASAICLSAVIAVSGCSKRPKNVYPVKGKVTLGGQPLVGALIIFNPTSEGSSSMGRTNETGEYVLQHSRGVAGAATGDYTVTITTFQGGDPSGKPPVPEVPEKVPFKYRTGPDVPKATVKPESNTIDFTLEPGPVEPPQAKGKRRGK